MLLRKHSPRAVSPRRATVRLACERRTKLEAGGLAYVTAVCACSALATLASLGPFRSFSAPHQPSPFASPCFSGHGLEDANTADRSSHQLRQGQGGRSNQAKQSDSEKLRQETAWGKGDAARLACRLSASATVPQVPVNGHLFPQTLPSCQACAHILAYSAHQKVSCPAQ